jgi:uncharacterized membrane protein
VLLAASAFVTAGVLYRMNHVRTTDTWNLVWNLFLAWIPYLLAVVVYDRSRAGGSRLVVRASAVLWLLFLPNAPYIVTDAIWLDDWRRQGMPLWFDLILYLVSASTGAILGFVSLYLVQRTVAGRRGEISGWLVAVVALLLSGVGVYLGRVLRWNSWDLFTRPETLLADVFRGIGDPLAYPRALSLTVLCAMALVGGYVVFYGLFRRQLAKLDER